MSELNRLANSTYTALTREKNYMMTNVDDQALADEIKDYFNKLLDSLEAFEDRIAEIIGEDMDESVDAPSAMRKLMSITEQDDDAVSEIYQALHDLGAEWNTKPSNWRQIGRGNNVVHYEDIESLLDKHGIVSADWSRYLAAPNPSASKTSSREVALVLVGDDMYLGFGRDAFYNQWVKVVS